MYKVFINDSPLSIISSGTPCDYQACTAVVESLQSGHGSEGKLCMNWGDFFDCMLRTHKYIEAAGGLVSRSDGKWLAIQRWGKWDLPKGKVENGEQLIEAAQREVEEECGISISRVIRELPSTYHTYVQNGTPVLKRTYWFLMETDQPDGTPQLEEGIEKIEWFSAADFDSKMEQSYASIADWNARRRA